MGVGGFGKEAFGDPLGGGGPLSVARALAVSGRVVRVVYTEEPTFISPAGYADSMNPTNYAFSIDTGVATSPSATAVDDALVEGPTRGVGNGGLTDERAVDVHVDRALIMGVTYRVTVSRVTASIGGPIGSPVSAAFFGIVPLQVTSPSGSRVLPGTDIGNSPFLGSWKVDDSGDIEPQGPADAFRKRVFRRMTTPLNAWAHLKGYGCAVRLKEIASLSQQTAYKNELQRQLLLEPETEAAGVQVAMVAGQILIVSVNIRTKKGAVVGLSLKVNSDGSFQPL